MFEALWSSPSPTLGWHCLTLWCSEGTWHPKNSWGGDFGCFNRPLWCSVGIWHPKNLWGEDFGCFNRPCSPLQPHFWGSVWPPNLQPHLSLLLGLSFCCLLPLKPWGSLLWPHSLCPWALCWMVGSFSSCQGQGGAAVPVSGVQLLPGEGCVKVLLCTVGLSDVLPHSWGAFPLKKKKFKIYFRSPARKWRCSPGEPGLCEPAAAEGGCDRSHSTGKMWCCRRSVQMSQGTVF